MPQAERLSERLNEGAGDLSGNVDEKVDKLADTAKQQAQQLADNTVPKAEQLSGYLKVPRNATHALDSSLQVQGRDICLALCAFGMAV